MVITRARRGHASLFASPISSIALLALACWGGSAHADVSTPIGDITGAVTLTTWLGAGGLPPVETTILAVSDNVVADGSGWVLSAPLRLEDAYPGPSYSSTYSLGGGVSLSGLPDFVAASGRQAGDISVTIEGTYATTNHGFVMFNPDFSRPDGYTAVSGNGAFSFTWSGEQLANRSNTLVSWAGSYAGSSSVVIQVTGLKLSQAVSAVPEPASAALMVIGLMGVGVFTRRVRLV